MLLPKKEIIIIIAVIVLWDLIWKGFALWRASKNNHHAWFIFILLLNTVGILPIIYILWFPKEEA